MNKCLNSFRLYLSLITSSMLITTAFLVKSLYSTDIVRRLTQSSTLSYEFLDSGNYKKLEKFGSVIISRSCPAASWKPNLSQHEWNKAKVVYTSTVSGSPGKWDYMNPPTEDWFVEFAEDIKFSLELSDVGQVGIFPEQLENWNWLKNIIKPAAVDRQVNVLNGFAYTGGSSIASLSSSPSVGVVHVDASKSSVQWAKKNVCLSGFGNRQVRYIVDDCMTFFGREIKRGNKFDGMKLFFFKLS